MCPQDVLAESLIEGVIHLAEGYGHGVDVAARIIVSGGDLSVLGLDTSAAVAVRGVALEHDDG